MNQRSRDYLAWLALLALWLAVLLSARVAWGATPALSYAQKQALVAAWRIGDHYQLGLVFAAVVYVESSACGNPGPSSAGAYGCAQVREVAAYEVTGATIPAWQLQDPNLREINMGIGARYLDLCMQRFVWPDALGCYNAGPQRTTELRELGCFHKHPTRAALRSKVCVSVRGYIESVRAAMVWLRTLPVSED